jgi:hypothetical protein
MPDKMDGICDRPSAADAALPDTRQLHLTALLARWSGWWQLGPEEGCSSEQGNELPLVQEG